MKNLIKFSVIFLGFFIIFLSNSIAADRILPLPKPSVDQETKAKTAKKSTFASKKRRQKTSHGNQKMQKFTFCIDQVQLEGNRRRGSHGHRIYNNQVLPLQQVSGDIFVNQRSIGN
mgnify:CR=1 FL=1